MQTNEISQISLILRVAGGAYLMYLAWSLRGTLMGEHAVVYGTFIAVFVLVGAALCATSVVSLVRKHAKGKEAESSQSKAE